MSESLYRKYRSSNFTEVVGQDHITKTLSNSIKSGTFSHAYLLTGLRGVGKTSVARILACSINNIRPENDKTYTDIIEIDAASNRKIDEIRDLREKVIIAPSSLKYKVYIIDEVHMLTKEAFNALLKTLEEPPAHVIFILATTDYHKLPETIISRCIRFSFKSIPDGLIFDHLKSISTKEHINISDEALNLIAGSSSGSLRDAISSLDQARNIAKKINVEHIELLLGVANSNSINKLFDAVLSKNQSDILTIFKAIFDDGASPELVVDQFIAKIKLEIESGMIKTDKAIYLELVQDLMKINEYDNLKLAFEIILLKFSLIDSEVAPKSQDELKIQDVVESEKTQEVLEHINQSDGFESEKVEEPKQDKMWLNVLDNLKKSNATLYGIARMADATANKDRLVLSFKFGFHKKQLDLKKNQDIILNFAQKLKPSIKSLEIRLDNENNDDIKSSTTDISNVSNIFGSAEVLES